jgi:hypothetical protein
LINPANPNIRFGINNSKHPPIHEKVIVQFILQVGDGLPSLLSRESLIQECQNFIELTFVMERDNKSPWQWTCEIEVDVRSPIIWDIALLDDTFFLQRLMRKLVRT